MTISVALACGRWRQEGHCKFQASQGSNIARLHPIKGKKEGRKGAGSGIQSNKAEVRIPAE